MTERISCFIFHFLNEIGVDRKPSPHPLLFILHLTGSIRKTLRLWTRIAISWPFRGQFVAISWPILRSGSSSIFSFSSDSVSTSFFASYLPDVSDKSPFLQISDQEQGRKADANWEFMDGVSASSSFSVDVREALDDENFDFEDAQSV